jgi:(2S)-methylsuccinyl-CoA dehydrogenase
VDAAALLSRLSVPLELGRSALDGAIGALAQATARNGRPDAERLEAYQPEAFRLAHLHARAHAAAEMLRYGARGELEALLALAFGARTLHELSAGLAWLRHRLEGVAEAAAAFAGAPERGALLRECGGDGLHGALLETMAARQSEGADGLEAEHRLLRSTFRAFAERKVAPIAERLHREDLLIPDDLIAEAAALGCFGLSIPAEHGGAEERPDNLGMVVVTEELSRGALIVGSLITRPEILAKALLKGGTPEQQARFLPPMASGEKMVAIAVTEPDVGSDVASIQTSATPADGGWRLNGTKVWSTFAGRAELIGLLARTEPDRALGHKGLGMFVVEKPAFAGHTFEHRPAGGGRLAGRAIPTLGYRGMHSFELTFEDYFLPAGSLVGGEAGRGQGFYLQMEGFSYGRLQTAARALGVMQSAFEHARAYAESRRVFGKALRDFALTREKLAQMAACVQASRQATYAAARLLDAGAGQVEASLVKLFACHHAEWITREAMQLHGGMGYAEEFAVSRLFADARVLSIFEGAEEVLALRVIVPALLRRALE